ncbi:MAG: hypothetical protein IKN72_12415 [Clostridia bacterium]|nr:hypothetical protein [Clostridia bacterium]MBR3554171.1 hypothetical protein [Clostridia bacterium]
MRTAILRFLSRLKRLLYTVLHKRPADDPDFDRPINGDDVFVDYYGCPNSNRTQKLQLGRNRYR